MDLELVKQKGLAAVYTADFQRIAFLTGYDNKALKRSYYQGLKEEVKDEIARSNESGTLELLIQSASRINKWLYWWCMKKAGKVSSIIWPEMKKGSKTFDKKPYYGPMPMEIDATRKQSSGRKSQEKAVKGNCYNCGKPGHYLKQCRLPRKPRSDANGKPGLSARKIAAITKDHQRETSHNAMSWTVCYDDQYPIHLSDKEGSGWFPKETWIRPLGEIVSDCVSEEFGIIEEWETGTARICSIRQDMAYNEEFYQSPDKDLGDYGNDSEGEGEGLPPTGDPTAAEFEDEASACFTLDMDSGEELYSLATGRLQDLCRQWARDYPGLRIIRGSEIFHRLATDLTNLLHLLLKEWENKLDRISSMYLL